VWSVYFQLDYQAILDSKTQVLWFTVHSCYNAKVCVRLDDLTSLRVLPRTRSVSVNKAHQPRLNVTIDPVDLVYDKSATTTPSLDGYAFLKA
jgi:hypothetical protein